MCLVLEWSTGFFATLMALVDEDMNTDMHTTTAAAPDENMEIDSRTLTLAASSSAPPEDNLPAPFSGPLTWARAHDLNFVLLLTNEGPEA
jgi:hypothetical protein